MNQNPETLIRGIAILLIAAAGVGYLVNIIIQNVKDLKKSLLEGDLLRTLFNICVIAGLTSVSMVITIVGIMFARSLVI